MKDQVAVAVAAAITSGGSNDQTEGQITKPKLIKCQMYGRGKIDLPRPASSAQVSAGCTKKCVRAQYARRSPVYLPSPCSSLGSSPLFPRRRPVFGGSRQPPRLAYLCSRPPAFGRSRTEGAVM
jgi:hypothetical protein